MNGTATLAGVHSIDHFALNVPSIAQATRFFSAFGLDVRETDDGALDLYALDAHRWARVLPSSRKSLAYLSFNCFDEDIAQIEKQVEKAGGKQVSPAALPAAARSREGFWFHDFDDNLVQVKVGPKTTPYFKIPGAPPAASANERGAEAHAHIRQVRPRRLSHLLLFTPGISRTLDFYRDALGLKLSDRSADIAAFTHARHGSDHHLVAFAHSEKPGWHHCAWDVANINEVGKGGAQMAAAGYTHGWGTGRHVLGSNYFHYVMDPWGSFCEYSADIDFIAADDEWKAGDFPPEDALYQWGPDLPDYFLKNTEITTGMTAGITTEVSVA